MKNDLKDVLTFWECQTEALVESFIDKYFKPDKYSELYHWVGGKVGGVISYNDYFFDVNQIADFIRLNYPIKLMFEYKDYEVEERMKDKIPLNMETYLSLKKEIKIITK